MKLSSRAHELFQAFEHPGCPVCRLTAESVHGYIGSLVYEYVNKPDTHFAVRDALGFCAVHAWYALERINASALGMALLYEGVLRNLLNDMGTIRPDSGRRQVAQAASALKPKAECPVCQHRTIVEDHLLRNLLEHLGQEAFAAGLRHSAGLCLPHLRRALDSGGKHAAKARLLAIQQDIWWALQADLAEFIRKSDYRFASTEELGREADSPHRAIDSISGAKDLR